MASTAVAQVWMWGRMVGAVAEDDSGVVTFEYDPAFTRSGLEISPFKLPLSLRAPVTFPELQRVESFAGLPGVLTDALPDRFGNAVIKKFFENSGRPGAALSPVQKLLYMGNRSMGALEFRPPIDARRGKEEESIEIASLVEQARKIVEGSVEVAVPEIMRLGSSAGGARPKAVILLNKAKKTVRSGFAQAKLGDEHWIIKFDGVGELDHPNPNPQVFNRIEFVYWLMAKQAGIYVDYIEPLKERGLTHLLVKRFDRAGNSGKVHMHSLAGLEHIDYNVPGAYSYEQYLRAVLRLNLGYDALEEAYRRAVFNIMARNQDDHVKNLSFLMDKNGRWSLSPAYDLTYAHGAGYTRVHQMSLGGRQDNFTPEQLERVAREFGLKHVGAHVIEQVHEALLDWTKLAKEHDVSLKIIRDVAADMRLELYRPKRKSTRKTGMARKVG